jgi:transposase InsO family protein
VSAAHALRRYAIDYNDFKGWGSLGSCRRSIHRRGPWRSFEAVEFATLEWVDWFNNRRLLEPIGNIPPAEAEQRYYAMLEQPAMAA